MESEGKKDKARHKRMRRNKKASKKKSQKPAKRGDTCFLYCSVITVMLPGYTVGTVIGWEYMYTMRNDAYFVSVPFVFIGAALGTIIAAEVMSKRGRHICLWTFFWFIYLQLIIRCVTDNPTLTCIVRFLSGISVGAYYLVVPTYIAEMVYRRHRGAIMAAVGCHIAIGVAASAASYASPLFLLRDFLSGVVFLVMKCFYAPETTYYYIARRKFGNAIETLKKCRTADKECGEIREVSLEVMAYSRDATHCLSFGIACCDLNIEILHRTVSSIGLLVLPVLMCCTCHMGANLDYYYNSGQYVGFLLQFIIVCLAFLVNIFVIDHFGRKILLMVSSIGVTIFYLILFALLCAGYERNSTGVSVVQRLVVLFFYLGLDFIPFLYFSEIFPYALRGAATGCIIFTYFIVHCIRPVLNFYALIYVDITVMVFAYFLIALASVFFCWFIPTETKQLSICAIQIKMDVDVDILEHKLYLH